MVLLLNYYLALSQRILDRIFSGAVMRRSNLNIHDKTKMNYWDFVWFIMSEEDKNHTKAIEYWFR